MVLFALFYYGYIFYSEWNKYTLKTKWFAHSTISIQNRQKLIAIANNWQSLAVLLLFLYFIFGFSLQVENSNYL